MGQGPDGQKGVAGTLLGRLGPGMKVDLYWLQWKSEQFRSTIYSRPCENGLGF
jgi:hypothetical protein